MYVTPTQASKYYAVNLETLRRWANKKEIQYKLTPGNHARYWIDNYEDKSFESVKNNENQSNSLLSTKKQDVVRRIDAIYCRVSSNKQKDDLERQKQYLLEKYPKAKTYVEIGSSLTMHRAKLQSLLTQISIGKISRVIITHKDRITRFGYEWFEFICNKYGTDIVVEKSSDNEFSKSPKDELVEDLLAVTHSFSINLMKNESKNIIQQNRNKQSQSFNFKIPIQN
eukprot:Pgem_evm2s9224